MRFTEISSSVVYASRFFDLPSKLAVATHSKGFAASEPAKTDRVEASGRSWDARLVRASVACILVMFNIVLATYVFPAAEQVAEMAGVSILDSIWIGFVSAAVGLPVIGAVNLLILQLLKRKAQKVGTL